MKVKLLFFLIVYSLAVLLLSSGCGGGGGGTGGGVATTTATTGGTTGLKPQQIVVISAGTVFYANNAGDVVGNSSTVTQALEYYGGSGFFETPAGTVTNLRGINGTSTNAHVQTINNHNLIVGNSPDSTGNRHATAWSNFSPIALQNPSGVTYSIATSVNDSGQIVGYGGDYSPGVQQVETLTESGSPTGGTFDLTFGGKTTTTAIPFNATAAQVGQGLASLSTLSQGEVQVAGGPLPAKAVTITFTSAGPQGTITASSSLTGGTKPSANVVTTTEGVAPVNTAEGIYWSGINAKGVAIGPSGFNALQINNSGEVVGTTYITNSNYTETFTCYKLNVSASQTVTTLTSISPNGSGSIYINNKGQIIAGTGQYGGSATFIDTSGQETTITATGKAYWLNDLADVVGVNIGTTSNTPYIWNSTKKQLVDPNTYLPKNSGWAITGAAFITDSGILIASAKQNGGFTQAIELQLPSGAY